MTTPTINQTTATLPLPGVDPQRLAGYSDYLAGQAEHIDRGDVGFGRLGVSLFNLYVYRYGGDEQYLDRARNEALASLQRLAAGEVVAGAYLPTLTESYSFMAQYGEELALENSVIELQDELEEILLAHGAKLLHEEQLDPYLGAYAVGYALLISGAGYADLMPYIEGIAEIAKRGSAGGAATPPPSGITHGLAFYLLFALSTYERFACPASKRAATLLLQELDQREVSFEARGCYYPDGSDLEKPSRLALAYGDLGILYARYRAGEILDDDRLRAATIKQLVRTGGRSRQAGGAPTDNRLLYGYCGVAYFYRQLHARTGHVPFAKLAERWAPAAGTQAREFAAGQLMPRFTHYDYSTMQRISLVEGGIGRLLAPLATVTNSTDFNHQLYLL